MSQKRLRLGILDTIFHYLMSIILVSVTIIMFYKLFTETFPLELESQKTNLICSGTIFLIASLFAFNRDYRKLDYNSVDLNGYDGKLAIQKLSELLTKQGWIIINMDEFKIVARGFSFKNSYTFFSEEKYLTLMIYEDQLLVNCIVAPPDSFRFTYGGTGRVVNNLISEFIRITNAEEASNNSVLP